MLAFGGILVCVTPCHLEKMRDDLGRLAHVEFDDRVGEAALQTDDGLEEARTDAGEGFQA